MKHRDHHLNGNDLLYQSRHSRTKIRQSTHDGKGAISVSYVSYHTGSLPTSSQLTWPDGQEAEGIHTTYSSQNITLFDTELTSKIAKLSKHNITRNKMTPSSASLTMASSSPDYHYHYYYHSIDEWINNWYHTTTPWDNATSKTTASSRRMNEWMNRLIYTYLLVSTNFLFS